MNLTQPEAAALARLKKRHSQWRLMRWILLVICLGLSGLGFYLEHRYSKDLLGLTSGKGFDGPASDFHVYIAAAYTRIITFAQIFRALGLYGAITLLAFWTGRPTDVLLLKLFQDQEPQAPVSVKNE